MSKKDETKIESLIDQLATEDKCFKPICPYRRISAWLILSVAYIVAVIAYLGPKVDIIENLQSASFLFEMGIAIAILITSAMASSWLSFPDSLQRNWMKIIAVTLFSIFLFWIGANIIEEGVDSISFFYLPSCSRGLAIEVLPFIALIFLTVRGRTTQPYWSMAMNVMAVSALGWIGLRLTCSMYDSMTYGFINYLLPFSVLGVGIGFFARKLFKW